VIFKKIAITKLIARNCEA